MGEEDEGAVDADIEAAVGCKPGSIGPVDLAVPFYVDAYAYAVADFCCGANEEGRHHVNVNWERDLSVPAERVVDARNVVPGEPAPDG